MVSMSASLSVATSNIAPTALGCFHALPGHTKPEREVPARLVMVARSDVDSRGTRSVASTVDLGVLQALIRVVNERSPIRQESSFAPSRE